MALFTVRGSLSLFSLCSLALSTFVQASLTSAQLSEYLDTGSAVTWQGAAGDWRLESTAGFTKDGVDSIRTPLLENSASTDFSCTVNGPGVLRGWVRVSSEHFQDKLGLALNGIVRQQWSGQQTNEFELMIPPGVQTVRFSWSKDANLTEGLDAAWLDQVSFTPDKISVAEALDLPASQAPGLVQFSVPAGMSPWTSYFTPEASNGGDVLISSPYPSKLRLGLLATLQVPAVVEFRTRRVLSSGFAPNLSTGVTVSFQSPMGGQYLKEFRDGEWTVHRVLVSQALSQIKIDTGAGNNTDEARFLDNMRISPALPVSSLAEALDAPGQVFAGKWVSVYNGSALNDPWMVLAEGTTAGLSRGGDMIIAPKPEVGVTFDTSSIRELSTEVTGPGRVSFWCATISGSAPLNILLTSLDAPTVNYNLPMHDLSSVWGERVMEVPKGRWNVAIRWSSSGVLALDQWNWTPTQETLPAPTVEAAVGAAGLAITQSGNWQGLALPEAGLTDNSAAVWNPLTSLSTPDDPSHLLRATADGEGWTTFSMRTGGLGGLRWEVDSTPYNLFPSLAHHPRTAWLQVARRLSPGAHTLSWTASSNARALPPWMVRLDGLGFSTAPPSWLADLDVPEGMDFWRMGGGSWQSDSGIKQTGATSLRPPPLPSYAAATIQSSFKGPGILRFWWRMQTQRPITSDNTIFGYRDNKDGFAQLRTSGVWTERTVMFRDAGEINATWTFRQNAPEGAPEDAAWLDGISFSQFVPPTLAEAMDTPSLTWSSGGEVAALSGGGLEWAAGGDAVRIVAGVSNAGWIETTVSGAGVASFRTSRTATVSVNGIRVGKLTGQAAFRLAGPGPHVCRIEGTTDVDDFQFLPLPLITVTDALDLAAGSIVSISGVLPGSYGILDATASFDGVDAVRLEETDATENSTAEAGLGVVLNGPCRIRFRWKSEGPGVASYGFPAVSRSGSFDWTEVEHLVLGAELGSFLINLDSEGVGNTKLLWVDQMVIEPYHPASLAEALQFNVAVQMAMDDPGRIWETSPDHPYVGFASFGDGSTSDEIDGVMPLGTAAGSWLQTTIQGPNQVMFLHKNFKGKFTVNGVPLKVTVTASWASLTFQTGPGSNVLRWEDTGPLDGFTATPVQTTLADALDFPGFWRISTSGSAPSTISFTDTSDGQDAVFTANSSVPRGAGYRLDVTGPGKMEFQAKAPYSYPITDLLLSEYGLWQGYYQPWWSPQQIDTIPPGPQVLSWPAGIGRDQVRYTPYQETPLNAALDSSSLTLSTNPANPWQGWAAGSAAFDSQDTAISNGSTASWLDINLPPGAGELRLMARSPIRITNPPNPFVSPSFLINNSSWPSMYPQNWKQLIFPINATDIRTVRVNPGSICLWLDQLEFIPAGDAFALWRTAQGLPSNVDLNSDPDGDNIPVLLEYALGLDSSRPGVAGPDMPADAGLPVFETLRLSSTGSYLVCHYYRRTGGRGLRYEVRFSNEPSTASALPTATSSVVSVNNDWERVTVRDPINGFPNARFGRLWLTYEP